MRLSDAIALGRTLKKAMPGCLGLMSQSDPGCALGMAHVAVGNYDASGLREVWPWMAHDIPTPCQCVDGKRGYSGDIGGTIAHLFDEHVFGAGDWTLDQLIDWVRSVEPSEAHAEEKTIAESAPSLVAQG